MKNLLIEDANYLAFLKNEYNDCLEKCVKDKAGDTKIRSQSLFDSYSYSCKNSECYKIKYLIDQQEKKVKKDDEKKDKPKHESYVNNYLNYIQESMFISDEPLVHKYDEWKKSKDGKLLIVGPSGSGKSTLGFKIAKKYKCRYIEIDDFTAITEDRLLKKKDSELLKTKKNSGDYWKVVHNNTMNYILNLKEKVVAEGIQPLWTDFDDLKNNASIIFLRTSKLTSLWRATIRNMTSLWHVRVWDELEDFEKEMLKLKKKDSIKEQSSIPDLASAHAFDGNNGFNSNNVGDAGSMIGKNKKWEKHLCLKKCDKILDPNSKTKCIEDCN